MNGSHSVLAWWIVGCVAVAGCAREGTRWVDGPPAAQDAGDAAAEVAQDLAPLDTTGELTDLAPEDLGPEDSLPPPDLTELVPADTADDTADVLDVSPEELTEILDTVEDDQELMDSLDTSLPDVELDIVSTWSDIDIISAHAPDDTHVVVVLSAAPQEEMSLGQMAVRFDSPNGGLAVADALWDSGANSLTFTTMKQKLGVTYTVALGSTGATNGLLSADFIAADSRVFWVTDFDDPAMGDMQVTAHRFFVGQYTVAYTMEGYDFEGAAAAAQEFDTLIYPTLTQALMPSLDFDGNGRIVLLYTDSDDYGGYFSPVNQWTNFLATIYGSHSNEMEILYISGWSGEGYFGQVQAHEFQHLLYYCRHLMKDGVHWDYHDEGLAESAVALVYGSNLMARLYYQGDPQQLISNGLSLVHWNWGLYENYALAYVFWAWVAGQLGGPEGYAMLFEIDFGGPNEVSQFLQDHLGMDLHQAVLTMMAAVRIQAESGLYSFNGMLTLEPAAGPMVPPGTSEAMLEPFGGVFFPTTAAQTLEPASHGQNVVFGGVSSQGEFDLSAPFDTTGGWLVAYNQNWNYHQWAAESTGAPSVSSLAPAFANRAPFSWAPHSPAWDSPPPRDLFRPEQWQNWRNRGGHAL